MDEEKQEIELEQHYIFMSIPEDTVALSITATLLDDKGNPYQVQRKMTASEIFEARKDFLDNVEDGDDYNVLWAITDKGREWLEQREKQNET